MFTQAGKKTALREMKVSSFKRQFRMYEIAVSWLTTLPKARSHILVVHTSRSLFLAVKMARY
jgi:hypothetical protein